MDKIITINSRKFDGSIHRTWQCKLIQETQSFFLFVGKFEYEVVHSKLGIIKPDTISYEYYFKEEWFNIFRFHEPTGELKYFYCNINTPPTLLNSVLDYIDLDIDILVKPDLTFEILDEEEFAENSIKLEYPANILNKVENSLSKLLMLINEGSFPFDFV